MLQGKESKPEKTVAQNPVAAASQICATTDSRSSFMCSQQW
ncbi:hypothetical protein N9Y31_07290 [Alphaproteobacteria bacterium]|nr:hypothetical protein [Alphaproteobacteria bacterium]